MHSCSAQNESAASQFPVRNDIKICGLHTLFFFYELQSNGGFALIILRKWFAFAKIFRENSERSILKTSEENTINHSETSGNRQSPLNEKSFP